MFARLIIFLKESKIELQKVVWPTKQETTRSTMAVVVISAALAVFLGGLDFAFQYILNNFLL